MLAWVSSLLTLTSVHNRCQEAGEQLALGCVNIISTLCPPSSVVSHQLTVRVGLSWARRSMLWMSPGLCACSLSLPDIAGTTARCQTQRRPDWLAGLITNYILYPLIGLIQLKAWETIFENWFAVALMICDFIKVFISLSVAVSLRCSFDHGQVFASAFKIS